MMRHSDPKLTANVYTRLELDEERAAVAKLEAFAGATPAETTPGNAPKSVGPLAGTEGWNGTETRSYDDARASAKGETQQTQRAKAGGLGSLDGPGLEPGTPGFSVLCSTN